VQSIDALHPMKISLFLAFLLTVASAFAADAMKFVSPDKSATLVVDKSGRRDIIELQSGKRLHRLTDEVEIKGESVVIINDDDGDKFTFTASVSKSGTVQHLTVVPNR